MAWFGFLVVGFTVLEYKEVQAVRCFECTHYPSPSLCTDITTCNSDQVGELLCRGGGYNRRTCCLQLGMYCTRYSNILLDFPNWVTLMDAYGVHENNSFNEVIRSKVQERCSVLTSMVGKRNTDITSCQVCCHGDLCNNEGCSKKAIPRDQRGPYCYSCDLMTKPDECDQLEICAKNELCLLHIPKNFLTYPDPIYKTECQSYDSCAALSGGSGPCPPTCCETDFCNDHCVNTTRPPLLKSTTLDTRPVTTTVSRHTKSSSVQITTQQPITKSTFVTSKTTITTSTTTTHGPNCRNHFYYIPSINFCIKIHSNKKTWADARLDCIHDHGDLLVYKTNNERKAIAVFMRNKLPKQHENEYWIGLSDPLDSQHFFYVNNEKVINTMWKEGQPDNDNENCGRASLSADMKWLDTRCVKTYSYICQTKPKW